MSSTCDAPPLLSDLSEFVLGLGFGPITVILNISVLKFSVFSCWWFLHEQTNGRLTVWATATTPQVLLTLDPLKLLWQNPKYTPKLIHLSFLPPLFLLSSLPIRWWVCWTREVCHISRKATMPSPRWRAASSPPPAWPPAAASAWITSRAWRVWPAFPPCRLCPRCPAPSPTAPPPTAHRATPSTTWHPTSTASTDKVRSIDFAFLFPPFSSTPRQMVKLKSNQINIMCNTIIRGVDKIIKADKQ